MISEIFKAILVTTLAGSALAAVISIFRPITKKIFGYSWHYYIWLCVLFVMLMPVRFDVNPAASPNITAQAVQTEQVTVGGQTETSQNNAQTEAVQKPQALQKASAVWDRIVYNRMNILAYLWLIGAIALMLLNVARYVKLNIKIRKNGKIIFCPEISEYTNRKINVRVWESIASPFMGVFKLTLILPKTELSNEQLHNILRHEMTHFKRHDILYKWFAEFVKCVHWFNPAAWYISKQISTECEISCDMTVTKNMSGSEEMSYINTILSLLPTGKSKQLPLTTQMASSKKILKRRFIMIKNKKTTSKFMSVISAVIAVVMLSATVFASGVLSDMTTDDYTIEITNNGEKIELANKPFIENGDVYVPLREIIEKSVSKDDGVTDIKWNDGTVDVTIAYYQGESGMYRLKIGDSLLGLKHISFDEHDKNFDEIKNNAGVGLRLGLKQTPVLKNSTTYIPLRDASYMLYSFTNRRDGNNVLRELTYNVYDKNGNEINLQPFSDDEVAAAKAVVEEYFRAANEKGARGELNTLTAWHNAPNVILTSDSDVILTLNNIQYDANDPGREEYVESGRGSVNNTSVDNVIVFRVDYDVSIPQGKNAGAYNEGNYNDWKMILIRDDKNGKWLIDDMGY